MWKTDISLSKIIKPRTLTYGTLNQAQPEEMLDSLSFKVFKYNNRPRPQNKNHIAIFACFSEFGSELIGSLYCIPKMLQERYLGYYVVVMGWQGREFLYKHMVDEFWELKEDYQWLREYCRAFHHSSKNLKKLERLVNRTIGKVIDHNPLSAMTLGDLYKDLEATKKTALWTPMPSQRAFSTIEKFLKPNSVGVTARYRKCYGRNLQIDFYKKLLDNLQDLGYDPIWIGEPATTYECPYSHITNFRDSVEACDLENTLALTSRLQFTIQFWTASSRLAGIMGTPFIIFESPDQIYGGGHEGLRLNLTTRGKKKLVIAHFWNVHDDNEGGIRLVKRAIAEMNQNNWNDIVGLVESQDVVKNLRSDNLVRIWGE